MIAFVWGLALRVLSLFVRRPRTVRWVCCCGYRKREQAVATERHTCPYCKAQIAPEVIR